MTSQVDSTGLTIDALTDLVAALTAKLQAVYGSDINVDPSSPDGQMINIFAQGTRDLLEALSQVYASFDLSQAFGASLDRLVALNGITRRGATFTFTNVTITTDRALTLAGLDSAINDPNGTGFTVSDDAGNQFILAATAVIAAPGANVLSFRAKNAGAVQTVPNTITNQVTITLGVTVVNNPSSATSVGVDEESDLALRVRHAQSFKLASTGPADAIQAAINQCAGVTDCFVYDNDTSGTVSTVPARSIWAIVENGAVADIAQAIYMKKGPGCGMKGSVTQVIVRPNGDTFTAAFDRPVSENLYIKFGLLQRYSGALFDNTLIKTDLAAALSYKLNQQATIGEVYSALATIAPQGIPTTVQVSKDGTNWFDNVSPSSLQNKFAVDVSRITIL